MKALLLSGGKGVRLRPITYTGAKQLIPIANKPILYYCLETLRDAGVKEVGIIVGETKHEIMEAVGDGRRWGVSVTYIEQESPLGLAHAVKVAKDYLKGAPFVMFLGDNLIKGGIAKFVEEFERAKPNALILLAKVEEPQRFGVAELEGEKIKRLVEKPKVPPSDLALVGAYLFDENIFEAVENISPSWRGELEITDAIQYLIDKGLNVRPHIITGWWKDTGKLEDILEANRLILDTRERDIKGYVDKESQVLGRVQIEEDTQIIGSTVRGPVVIGRKCRIINSYIGPFTSVHHQVVIENSEVEHSIVLEGSRITNIEQRIVDSLIGKNVEVSTYNTRPRAFRLMLGDASKVLIT